jgi:ergothioneine biosynthesis protein EgtB
MSNSALTGLAATGSCDEATGSDLLLRYQTVRGATERLCETLEVEDFVVQTSADVSPTKWHLAHSSWFFETFVLAKWLSGYRAYDEIYGYLFNSYYNAVGKQFPRSSRGHLSRPTVEQVFAYRAHVDGKIVELLDAADPVLLAEMSGVMELGLHHEQQHQELILTDIKHVFFMNPARPVYRPATSDSGSKLPDLRWRTFSGEQQWIGYDGMGFAYDNERPRHKVYVESFQLASRLVTNGEYLEFMSAGGYERPELWLSDGWTLRCANQWGSPLYWERRDDEWWNFTLQGTCRIDPAVPVCHVSFYEADAYARWRDAWLPTEAAWEVAARDEPVTGNFGDTKHVTPRVAPSGPEQSIVQLFGDVWEWTCSPYVRYPRFRPSPGALGEYNAKFMSNQMVLRGGSCASPASHVRPTYRNFFPPHTRWQFSGIRLSRELQ